MDYSSYKTQFPPQKKPDSEKKKEKWQKDCINAAISLTTYGNKDKTRDSLVNMKSNYKLYDGILDMNDVERTVNPWGLAGSSFPEEMFCYPIGSSKIKLLLGEESKRRFDWKIRVTNDDAISDKEKYIKEAVIQRLTELITAESLSEEQAKQATQDLERWKNYEAQDIRERLATQILKHLYQEQKLKMTFNEGFKDALIAGEEIYCADIVAGKPILRRVNPLNLRTFGITNSNRIEDADVIVEDGFYSRGWVIDNYYDYLKPSEIDRLEKGYGTSKSSDNLLINYPDSQGLMSSFSEDLIDIPEGTVDGQVWDSNGNIRVTRTVWRSLRKIGILTYFDEETGEPLETLVPEQYKPDKDLGETVKWYWINEWWEGTRIMNDIYVKVRPRPIQFRRMDNLSLSGSGYVGTIYSTNFSRGNSVMNQMKPYIYMYNKISYRIDKAIAKYKGPMVELDLSKKPGSWELDKWMYFAEEMGYLVVDSFNEGQKGQSQGKLAGNFNTTGKVMNPELGNYIAQNMELLRFIEDSLGNAIGITRQREGSIDNRETVGGVERSVTQSSHITEELFLMHDQTKLRALEVLLETAKFAYLDDKSQVAQYIMDSDLAQQIYTIDGELFNEADYGLIMTDSSSQMELKNALIQLAHAGIQNQVLNFSTFMDIYMTESIADMRRKIERAEQEMQQRQQQQQETQQKHEEKMLQMEIENREDQQAHQIEIERLKSDTQIEVKLLDIESKNQERLETPEEDNSFDKVKFLKEYALKERELEEEKRQARKEEQQKDEELAIKRIAATKPKTTSK